MAAPVAPLLAKRGLAACERQRAHETMRRKTENAKGLRTNARGASMHTQTPGGPTQENVEGGFVLYS